jgi:TetR/AcrR family transcriptional regulator, cholesterol catabolism regulator
MAPSGDRASGSAAPVDAARAEWQKIVDSGLPLGAVAAPAGRGEETRERILDTAIALFGERGFEACTMRDLATEVGIKAPAIYNHYASKEDVLAAAMEHIAGRFFCSLAAVLEDEPIEGWLETIVKHHVRFLLGHRRLARANEVLINAPGRAQVLPHAAYERLAGVERSYVVLIGVLTRRAAPEADQWDGLMSGFAITAMCNRVVAWYDPEGVLTIEQVADRSWKLAQQMIGAGSQARR